MKFVDNLKYMGKKIYLIYFEWSNTAGNHAGMAYLANKLAQDIPNVLLIKMIGGQKRWMRALNLFYAIYFGIKLRFILKPNDKVFLMEYMARSCFQDLIAKTFKSLGGNNEISGLVHLAGSHLMEIYKEKSIIAKKMSHIDRCIVLGSSLSDFFKKEIGYQNVVTTFHYVDNEYYHAIESSDRENKVGVLVVGNTKRDFTLLQNLVKDQPDVQFDICQGRHDWSCYFGDCDNVKLHGFLDEDDLRSLMQQSDISLSVMEDTIGSNVIVTSLTTGMISVVSDVGSIRDYLTPDESFLCKNEDDFVKALRYISEHRDEIPAMKKKSVARGQLFAYSRFLQEFKRMFDM